MSLTILTKEESKQGAKLEVEDFTDYNGENGERWVRLIDEQGRVFSGYVSEEYDFTNEDEDEQDD